MVGLDLFRHLYVFQLKLLELDVGNIISERCELKLINYFLGVSSNASPIVLEYNVFLTSCKK